MAAARAGTDRAPLMSDTSPSAVIRMDCSTGGMAEPGPELLTGARAFVAANDADHPDLYAAPHRKPRASHLIAVSVAAAAARFATRAV